MSDKIDPSSTSTKLVLPNGQKVVIGSQLGTFGALLLILWQGVSAAQSFIREAEATRETVQALAEGMETLGQRMDKVDSALAGLVDNDRRLAALESLGAQQQLEITAAMTCARSKGKTCPP